MALVEDEKWRKILRTFQDVTGSISGEALKAFESVADLGTRAVALTGEAFGADTQKIWDFADRNLVEDWYYKPLGVNQRDSESYLNDWKYGETVRQVSGMAGGLAGSIIMGGMAKGLVPAGASGFVKGAIGTLPIGLKQAGFASGKASQELKERNEGQDISFGEKTKAMAYGTMSGLAEWGISNISGAGEIAGLGPKDSFKEIAKGALGEGFETILSNVADPILKKMTYAPETNVLLDDSENIKERAGDIGKEALIATLLSGGIQTAQYGLGKMGDHNQVRKEMKRLERLKEAEIADTERIMRLNEQTLANAEPLERPRDIELEESLERPRNIMPIGEVEETKTKIDIEDQEIFEKENPTFTEIKKIKDPVMKAEKSVEKLAVLEQGDFLNEDYMAMLQEEIDSRAATRDLDVSPEWEELQNLEYSPIPHSKTQDKFLHPEEVKYKQYLDENMPEGQLYKKQSKQSAMAAEGLSDDIKKTIKEEVPDLGETTNVREKLRQTTDYMRKTVGVGEKFDPTSETVLYFLSDSNKDDMAAVNSIIQLAEEARRATTDKARIAQLNDLTRRGAEKLVQIPTDWGLTGNEIQAVYNAPTAAAAVQRTQKYMDDLWERDSDLKHMQKKIDKKDYEITVEQQDRLNVIWDEETRFIEQAQKDGKNQWMIEDLENRRAKRVYMEATKNIEGTVGEKAREWRQVSMLFNPRTLFARNPLGNVEAMALDQTNFMKGVMNWVNKKFVGVDTSMSAEEFAEYKKIYAKALFDAQAGRGTTGMLDNKYIEDDINLSGGPLRRDKWTGKIADKTYELLDWLDTPFERATYEAELYRSRIVLKKAIADGVIGDVDDSRLEMMVHNAAKHRAQVMTFKDDNKLTEKLTQFKNTLNNVGDWRNKYGYGLGDQAIVFLKTPANVAKFAWDRMPISAITSSVDYVKAKNMLNQNGTIENLVEFDQATQKLAKGLYGSMLQILGVAAGYTGIIEANEHERGQYDKTSFNKQKLGKQGLMLNIGGKKIPLGNFDIMNIFISPAVAVGEGIRQVKDHPREDRTAFEEFKTIFLNGVEQQADAILEQASLKSFNNLLKGFQANGWEGLAEAAQREIAGIPTQFIPTGLAQTARATDPYERQVYERAFFGNMKGQVMGAIPGLRQMLPKKVDVYGEEMQMFDDTESFIKHVANKMILPSEVKTVDDSFITQEIERVGNATGENVYPYAVPTRLEGKDLKAGEISDKQKVAGQRFVKNAEALFETNKYKEATDEEKAKMLKNLAKTPSKQEMKHGAEPIAEKDMGEATTFNMLSKSGIDPQYLKDIKYAGGTQQDKLEAVANLDISGDQKLILFKSLYPDNKGIPDEALIQAMVNTGMSREEILNYSKLLGVVLDANPLRLDTDVEDREAYNDMLYGLKAVDEKDTMKNAVYQVLPENAPEIIKEASSLAKNEEQLVNYLSKLEIDGIQKLILYKRMVPKKDEGIDDTIAEYIVGLDMSDEQKKRILRELKII